MVTLLERDLASYLVSASNKYADDDESDVSSHVFQNNGATLREALVRNDHSKSDVILSLTLGMHGTEIISDRTLLDSFTAQRNGANFQHNLSAIYPLNDFLDVQLKLDEYTILSSNMNTLCLLRQTSDSPFGLISREGIWVRVQLNVEKGEYKLQVEATEGYREALDEISAKLGLDDYVLSIAPQDHKRVYKKFPDRIKITPKQEPNGVIFETDEENLAELEKAIGRKLPYDTVPVMELRMGGFGALSPRAPFTYMGRANTSRIIGMQKKSKVFVPEDEIIAEFLEAVCVSSRININRVDSVTRHPLDYTVMAAAFMDIIEKNSTGEELPKDLDLLRIVTRYDPTFFYLHSAAPFYSSFPQSTHYNGKQILRNILSRRDAFALCRWYSSVVDDLITKVNNDDAVHVITASDTAIPSELPENAKLTSFGARTVDAKNELLPGEIYISACEEDSMHFADNEEIRIECSARSTAIIKHQDKLLKRIGISFRD